VTSPVPIMRMMEGPVDELIRQIRLATNVGLYYLALFGALALPDICGALASSDGKGCRSKYIEWLRDSVPEQAGAAELIYGLRCSLIHQGRALPHGSAYPMAFTFPALGGIAIHNLLTVVGEDQVGWTSIPALVQEVTTGAERWLRQFENTVTVTRNLEKFARLRPDGLPPHFTGPVIA
jgi:hypothetical protein